MLAGSPIPSIVTAAADFGNVVRTRCFVWGAVAIRPRDCLDCQANTRGLRDAEQPAAPAAARTQACELE